MRSTVLIVDDDPIGLQILETLLQSQNVTLVKASDGAEALAQAMAVQPDLILLDVIMPRMDGFEVCRRLRQTPDLAEVPIILLTALDDRDSRLRGIQAGADDFIAKPYDRLELGTRVQTIVRLNRYRRLVAERTRFAQVVEEAADGYVLLNSQAAIQYANLSARLLLGLGADSAEFPPDDFLTLAQQHYICRPDHAWQQWPGLPPDVPAYLVRPATSGKAAQWLHVEMSDAGPNGDGTHLVRLRDITDETNQQRLTWQFHAQIQHKFRHRLNSLSGNLELLAAATDEDSATERQLLAQQAWASAEKLKGEILRILDFLDSSTAPIAEANPCRLACLPSLVQRLQDNLALENLSLYTDIPSTPEQRLALPASAVETILSELLDNARKFHPTHAPHLDVHLLQRGGALVMRVTDDGLTLSPDQLRRIWTPYYQAEHYFTGRVSGLGLGLSMVAALAWSVGGACRAYNRLDRSGLVVEVSLPLFWGEPPPGTGSVPRGRDYLP